tara:strand:- start:253 stop:528 length:276 start_codon:yes stop_codon:yes gene_type:complete
MKKITLSVVALSITISGFSTNPPTSNELVKEISMTTEDMIQSMRIINTNDSTITKEISEIYIHNLLDILSKLEDIQMLNYGNNCENCDEID